MELAEKDLLKMPVGWKQTTLKNICEKITKGSTPTSYGFSYKEDGINFVKTENINEKGYIADIKHFIDEKTNEFLKRSILFEYDILFSIAGTIGRVGIVKKKDLPANTNQALSIIRLFNDTINPKYLFYFLISEEVQKATLNKIVGVGRANLSLQNLGQFQIPVAPIQQQERIVAEIEKQFSRLDEAVENLKRVKVNLKRYKASVLKAAVEGRLTKQWRAEHPDVEPASKLLDCILTERRKKWEEAELAKMKAKGKEPKDGKWKKKYKEPLSPAIIELNSLPNGWAWVTVEQIASPEPNAITDGPFGSNLKTEHYTEHGPRVIRLQNIGSTEFIDEKAHISEKHFETLLKHSVAPNDVIIAALGRPAPRACLVPTWLGKAVVKADCIRLRTSSHIVSNYIMYSLNSEPIQKRTESIVHGIGRPRLNLGEIKSLVIPLPPESEQKAILDKIDYYLSVSQKLMDQADSNLNKAEKLRQSVLQKAFKGHLVAQNSTDEPAKELINRITQEQFNLAKDSKGKRRKKVAKDKEITLFSVIDILKESHKAISTAQLVEKCGYPKNASPEIIEPFYLDLKRAIEANKIVVQRKGNFDYFKMKRSR